MKIEELNTLNTFITYYTAIMCAASSLLWYCDGMERFMPLAWIFAVVYNLAFQVVKFYNHNNKSTDGS